MVIYIPVEDEVEIDSEEAAEGEMMSVEGWFSGVWLLSLQSETIERSCLMFSSMLTSLQEMGIIGSPMSNRFRVGNFTRKCMILLMSRAQFFKSAVCGGKRSRGHDCFASVPGSTVDLRQTMIPFKQVHLAAPLHWSDAWHRETKVKTRKSTSCIFPEMNGKQTYNYITEVKFMV